MNPTVWFGTTCIRTSSKREPKVLNEYFTLKRSTFADRAKFYEAVRSDGETIEEWNAYASRTGTASLARSWTRFCVILSC
ncbi:reverse transcriptase [Operophtera brumata]|uniref:Reverse transcriptase n=1 Tax=Operophtera brumata TaxID=104452 RepID=A0A0L7KNC0_OPEBR|nr:reverse transcriptase [Operophtera brumata]